MNRKDQGLIHYVFAMILFSWIVLVMLFLIQFLRMERLKAYLEDCMTQAGLAALLIEPYTYGMSGELVFGEMQEVEEVYLEYLHAALGSAQNQERLGIAGEVAVAGLIVYEKTGEGILAHERQENGNWVSALYGDGDAVFAPDGTEVVAGTIYACIRVPVRVWGGVTVEIERQHCVDIV